MSRLWPDGESIEVEARADGWPLRFVWHGRSHVIEQVTTRWQVSTDWWAEEGEIQREYLKLVTQTGLLCEVYFDLLTHVWCLSRVYD